MKKGRQSVLRLKGVLMRDKSQIPDGFNALLSRDAERVLEQYFDLTEDGIKVSIAVGDDGSYEVRLQANATRLKNLPIII